MKGKSIIKRLTIYSSMVVLLFTITSSNIRKRNKGFFLSTTRVSNGKIEYSSGTIYIGSRYYLDAIRDYLEAINCHNENDVFALDDRGASDPNIRIYDSYKIYNKDTIEEIVDGLLLYEEEYPSKWDRTKDSMIREWIVHNLMYQVGYEVNSSIHVDLNNDDEDVYKLKKYPKYVK